MIQSTESTLRVPFGLHGDDAGVHGQNQVLCFTWGGVASRLPTLDSRIIFSMIRTKDMVDTTMDMMMEVLVWPFQALSEGEFPRCDHKGRVFDAGWESLAPTKRFRFAP